MRPASCGTQIHSVTVFSKIWWLRLGQVLLNNWDRLPLIWENEGNPGNLMLLSGGGLLAIDQAAVGLAPAHRGPYLEKVRQLCRELAQVGRT